MNSYTHLKAPITICGKTYRNRIGASPLGRLVLDQTGNVIDEEIENFRERAKGGCAVVCVGECFVDNEYSCRENDTPMDFSPENTDLLEKIRRYPDAIHEFGAVAMAELNHCGQSKTGKGCRNKIALGPMDWEQPDGIHNVAMNESMMIHVAENFARCARFMQCAGFDGAVIFCGHGWLLHQFLSPRTNRRTDLYGGILENRARFPMMVLRQIRRTCGLDLILEIRVSGTEGIPGGMELDEVAHFCQMLDQAGLADIIQVSQGIYREPVLSREFSSIFHETACNSMNAKYIREQISLPVSVVGGINSPEVAEQILEDGRCDIVLLGRELFADPNFANKVLDDRADEVNHCVRCYKCFPGPHEDIELPEGMPDGPLKMPMVTCTVNPLFTRSLYMEPFGGKAATPKRVLVIGGGVAGMQSAIACAERGHSVTLVEQKNRLGGILTFCNYDVHKGDLRFFRDQLSRKLERRNVKVLLNMTADHALVQSMAPEYIICAVGSVPNVPPIPGIENASHILQAYETPAALGHRLVIVGGGLSGCEVALHYADLGKEVTVVEMTDQLAVEGEKMHRTMLLHLLKEHTTCLTNTRCAEIRADGIVTESEDGTQVFRQFDAVIYALGMCSRAKEVESLRLAAGSIPFVTVGDCKQVQQVAQAGFDAFTEAMHI